MLGGVLRTIGFFGNCQVQAIHAAAEGELRDAGFASFFVRSWGWPGDVDPAPARKKLDSCVMLFEQDGAEPFPARSDLPAGCAIVRFAALATNLLWPFQVVNPYGNFDATGARFAGNRVLLRAIEQDWDTDTVVAYYLDRYDTFRVDLARMAKIERERLHAQDALTDVAAADLIGDVVTAPIFGAPAHPRAGVLEAFGRRLFARAAREVPELAVLCERFEMTAIASHELFDQGEVPIHPGVAAELGLAWYDPATVYHLAGGVRATHDEFVRLYVESSILHRRRQHEGGTAEMYPWSGFRPTIEGAARLVGPAIGMYPDLFAAPRVRFEIEAVEAVGAFVVEAYYPPQQRRPGTIVCSVGGASAETTVEPGSALAFRLQVDLAPGERAAVAMTCSETLNMVESGEGADSRDLGVLVLKLLAVGSG